jgi:hypothetical protein
METMLFGQPSHRSDATAILGLSLVSGDNRVSLAGMPLIREVLLTSRRVVDYAQVASSLCCR